MNYTGTIAAKNNSLIPVRDAVCFHSKYNPEREGEQFAVQYADGSSFFVVLGLCGGYHLAALANRFPSATIITVENTDEDIDFLAHLPLVQTLSKNPQIIITTAARLSSTLYQHFLPAEHTALQITALRAWENAFPEQAKSIRSELQQTLSAISADFSVQSHFGGLWQRNILMNLRLAAAQPPATYSFPHEKIAAIIAAGPSLDERWQTLAQHRDDYYIIATDTGYRALLRHGIVSDAVVCVDAQIVSHAHFFDCAPSTLCVLDLSVHPAVSRTLVRQNSVLFVKTGHPLADFAGDYYSLPFISAGSGTVTIAAAHIALLAGFSKMQFFGADFGYTHGKAYAQGSYLDDLYNAKSNRLHTAETQFSHLLYRTELKTTGNGTYTTDVLESYKKSLKTFLEANNFQKNADNVYIRHEAHHQFEAKQHKPLTVRTGDYQAFVRAYKDSLEKTVADGINKRTAAWMTLLPYIAWLKKQQGQQDFESLVRLAYTKTWEYL